MVKDPDAANGTFRGPVRVLGNGVELPEYGYGTFPLKEELRATVPFAIRHGCRLVDTSVLTEVSSGGVFWALTISVIRSGGVVYGACRVDRDTVRHRRAETLKEAEAMRRSKYLISERLLKLWRW